MVVALPASKCTFGVSLLLGRPPLRLSPNADFRAGRSTLHGGGRWLAHIDAGSDNAAAVALPGFGPRANTPHWTGLR